MTFDEAAAAGPASVADSVREFGRRTNITPQAFDFALAETADGPRYEVWVSSG